MDDIKCKMSNWKQTLEAKIEGVDSGISSDGSYLDIKAESESYERIQKQASFLSARQ